MLPLASSSASTSGGGSATVTRPLLSGGEVASSKRQKTTAQLPQQQQQQVVGCCGDALDGRVAARQASTQSTGKKTTTGGSGGGGGNAQSVTSTTTTTNTEAAERRAKVLQEKKRQADSLVEASRACLTKTINPFDLHCHNTGFYLFAMCMERLMHGVLSKTIRSLQKPEEARGRARDAIAKVMAEKPHAGALLYVLSMVDTELSREWPMETGETLRAVSEGLMRTSRFEICQRYVLAPPPPEELLNEEAAAAAVQLSTDGVMSAADAAMLRPMPKWKPLPTAFPPMEKLRIVSARGDLVLVEVDFGHEARGVVMERDCYFNNLRYACFVLQDHPFFRRVSRANHVVLLPAAECYCLEFNLALLGSFRRRTADDALALLARTREEAQQALMATLRCNMEAEAQVIIAEGAAARAQLDGRLDAAREAMLGVENRLEMCRRDAEQRLGALESSREAGEFADSIQGILDVLKAAFTQRQATLEAELETRKAEVARLELEMVATSPPPSFGVSTCSPFSSSRVSSPASSSGGGGRRQADAALWAKIQEAEAVKQCSLDAYVEEVAQGIMVEVDAHLEQFRPFAPWVGEVATSLSSTLKECMCLQEVMVDARMTMHMAMRKHFDSVA